MTELAKLTHLYALVAEERSDEAIEYFFDCCLPDCDSLLRAANVKQLDAAVIVAMLLGTRVRQDQLPSRPAFSLCARVRLEELLDAERVLDLWTRVA
jgi:hypothetical protein